MAYCHRAPSFEARIPGLPTEGRRSPIADAPPPRPATTVRWSHGCIAVCAYHVDGQYLETPQKTHIMPSMPRRCRTWTAGNRAKASAAPPRPAAATTRRRYDPPPLRPAAATTRRSRRRPVPATGHKVGGRDPVCPSGGLVWAARCALNIDALCTLKPAKDPHLRPLRPLHLDLHGGKPKARCRLPAACCSWSHGKLEGWSGGPSRRRLCASSTPPELP